MTPTPPPGEPFSYENLMNWAWVLLLAIWGGVASFMRKRQDSNSRPWNIVEFIGEICISGFTGVAVAHLCDYVGAPPSLKYFMVGIMAHMGSRALFKLERIANQKAGVDDQK